LGFLFIDIKVGFVIIATKSVFYFYVLTLWSNYS